MPKAKLQIVIDADVARASSETDHPVSSSCRKALNLVLENQHQFVACSKLRGEWRKHASGYSRRWLSSMIARKQVSFIAPSTEVSTLLPTLDVDEKLKRIVLKDAHLLDAARSYGKLVASRDDAARGSVALIQEIRHLVTGIIWANPTTDGEELELKLSNSSRPCSLPRLG